MRLPRDISGVELIRKLAPFGYTVTRQAGSHVRLTTSQNGEHHLTIPIHKSLHIGTLAGILADVAKHHGLTREELLEKIGW
jgi:predicted RNA binding protein YcfA (HicA-like mRNA interferase family)